jgi:hypothetical protein
LKEKNSERIREDRDTKKRIEKEKSKTQDPSSKKMGEEEEIGLIISKSKISQENERGNKTTKEPDNPSIKLVNQSIKLVNQSIKLVNQSIKLVNQSIKLVNHSEKLSNIGSRSGHITTKRKVKITDKITIKNIPIAIKLKESSKQKKQNKHPHN